MGKQKIPSRPNVLFIICDDLNNAITDMGCTPCPNLHSLMAEGVRFANAHSNCPICLPARNMLLSGLYAHQTGHFTLWDQWRSSTHIYTTSERRAGPRRSSIIGQLHRGTSSLWAHRRSPSMVLREPKRLFQMVLHSSM